VGYQISSVKQVLRGIKDRVMRQVDRLKISVGVNSRTMCSKDSIGLNIDYTEI